MSFQVYIIYSKSSDTFYKGQTNSLNDRLSRHNNRQEKATKSGAPWTLIWKTEVPDRSSAVRLERKLKNLSRNRLMDFIERHKDDVASPDYPDL